MTPLTEIAALEVRWHRRAVIGLLASSVVSAGATLLADVPPEKLESLRGRIVWLDAMGNVLKVPKNEPPKPAAIALVDTSGKQHRILPDPRGRGFAIDPRLLAFDYELLVRRLPTSEVQVIRVYTWHAGKKYEFDYWCDICAIPMFELKECECCQGEIRFRERLVEGDRTTSNERERS